MGYFSLVESELHDGRRLYPPISDKPSHYSEQGTTERLSKFWMPLDDYIKTTMDGLTKGNTHIAAGRAEDVYKRFEELDQPFPTN
jgi:hypothetical protein